MKKLIVALLILLMVGVVVTAGETKEDNKEVDNVQTAIDKAKEGDMGAYDDLKSIDDKRTVLADKAVSFDNANAKVKAKEHINDNNFDITNPDDKTILKKYLDSISKKPGVVNTANIGPGTHITMGEGNIIIVNGINVDINQDGLKTLDIQNDGVSFVCIGDKAVVFYRGTAIEANKFQIKGSGITVRTRALSEFEKANSNTMWFNLAMGKGQIIGPGNVIVNVGDKNNEGIGKIIYDDKNQIVAVENAKFIKVQNIIQDGSNFWIGYNEEDEGSLKFYHGGDTIPKELRYAANKFKSGVSYAYSGTNVAFDAKAGVGNNGRRLHYYSEKLDYMAFGSDDGRATAVKVNQLSTFKFTDGKGIEVDENIRVGGKNTISRKCDGTCEIDYDEVDTHTDEYKDAIADYRKTGVIDPEKGAEFGMLKNNNPTHAFIFAGKPEGTFGDDTRVFFGKDAGYSETNNIDGKLSQVDINGVGDSANNANYGTYVGYNNEDRVSSQFVFKDPAAVRQPKIATVRSYFTETEKTYQLISQVGYVKDKGVTIQQSKQESTLKITNLQNPPKMDVTVYTEVAGSKNEIRKLNSRDIHWLVKKDGSYMAIGRTNERNNNGDLIVDKSIANNMKVDSKGIIVLGAKIQNPQDIEKFLNNPTDKEIETVRKQTGISQLTDKELAYVFGISEVTLQDMDEKDKSALKNTIIQHDSEVAKYKILLKQSENVNAEQKVAYDNALSEKKKLIDKLTAELAKDISEASDDIVDWDYLEMDTIGWDEPDSLETVSEEVIDTEIDLNYFGGLVQGWLGNDNMLNEESIA